MEHTRRAQKAAIEAGDTDAQLEASDKLGDLRADLREREAEKRQIKQPQAVQPQRQPHDSFTAEVADWAARVGWDSWGDATKLAAGNIGKRVSAEYAERYPGAAMPPSRYVAEVDKRMRARYPHLFERQNQRRPQQRIQSVQAGRGEPSPQGGDGDAGRNHGSRRVMTQDDYRAMRAGGFDPNSKKDRDLWARANQTPLRPSRSRDRY